MTTEEDEDYPFEPSNYDEVLIQSSEGGIEVSFFNCGCVFILGNIFVVFSVGLDQWTFGDQ